MIKKILKEILKRILFYSCFLLSIAFEFAYESTWSNYAQFDTQNGRYAIIVLRDEYTTFGKFYKIRIICRDYQSGKEVKYTNTSYTPPNRVTGEEGFKFLEINTDEAELIMTDGNGDSTFEFVWADIFD